MTITNITNDCHKSFTHDVTHKPYGRDIIIIFRVFVLYVGIYEKSPDLIYNNIIYCRYMLYANDNKPAS
jgi:hypothetical protein